MPFIIRSYCEFKMTTTNAEIHEKSRAACLNKYHRRILSKPKLYITKLPSEPWTCLSVPNKLYADQDRNYIPNKVTIKIIIIHS